MHRPRWVFGTLVFCTSVVCDVLPFRVQSRSWVVVNIINCSASGALHVCLPYQVWPLRSKCCGRQAPTKWHMLILGKEF